LERGNFKNLKKEEKMKDLIERQAKGVVILMLVLLILVLLLLASCVPLGVGLAVDTNLPFNTTRIIVLNATPYEFQILFDGVEQAKIKPYGRFARGLWNGSYYPFEISLSVVSQNFAHTEKVWIYSSSYSSYSYTLTIREEDGKVFVERR